MPHTDPEQSHPAGEAPEGLSGAAALKETLESLGVEYLFGMESPPGLHAELAPGRIRPITIRDERSGAFMADGYARVSGKPGVCGVSGVGATNMVQGIVESYLGSTPVIVLSEESSGTTRHRNDLQDIDRLPIFASITKWACQVEDPTRLPDLVAHAFRVATTGCPGPVFVGCPWDVVSRDPAGVHLLELQPSAYPAARVAPDPELLEKAVGLLETAHRPVLVAGGGVLVSGAEAELLALARRLRAPVAVTPSGKGSFDEEDPLFAGVVGSYTSGTGGRGAVAHEIVHGADLVVLIGTKTGSSSTANWTLPHREQRIVHMDIDPVEIGRNYPRSLPLVGDAKLGLADLDGRLGTIAAGVAGEPWAQSLLEAARLVGRPPGTPRDTVNGVHPESVFSEIQERMGASTLIVADAGYCAAWALDRLRLKGTGRRFLGPRAYGSMGYGLPAAIGAKLADPVADVVCIAGDGAMGFSLGELETAARYGVALTTVVFNNSSLAWSRHYNRKFYGYDGSTDFSDVDYSGVARALGWEGLRVSTADDFAGALDKALGSDVATLIDVRVDPEVHPPVEMFG